MQTATLRPAEQDLAALITAPVQLPVRADGERMRHLSVSSLNLWYACEEKFRRRYLLGQREPTSPGMYLGTAVDNALTAMNEAILRGETPEAGDVHSLFDQLFESEQENQKAGIAWTRQEPAEFIRSQGHDAVTTYLKRLQPLAGRPIATQRDIHVKVSPACEWDIYGRLDLITVHDRPLVVTDKAQLLDIDTANEQGAVIVATLREGTKTIRDYKVKNGYVSKQDADGDIQPSVYLIDSIVRGDPADAFVYLNVVRPGAKRVNFDAKAIYTARPRRSLRNTLLRFAAAAQEICERVETRGIERPWKFADPNKAFPCRARFCRYHATCPGAVT